MKAHSRFTTRLCSRPLGICESMALLGVSLMFVLFLSSYCFGVSRVHTSDTREAFVVFVLLSLFVPLNRIFENSAKQVRLGAFQIQHRRVLYVFRRGPLERIAYLVIGSSLAIGFLFFPCGVDPRVELLRSFSYPVKVSFVASIISGAHIIVRASLRSSRVKAKADHYWIMFHPAQALERLERRRGFLSKRRKH